MKGTALEATGLLAVRVAVVGLRVGDIAVAVAVSSPLATVGRRLALPISSGPLLVCVTDEIARVFVVLNLLQIELEFIPLVLKFDDDEEDADKDGDGDSDADELVSPAELDLEPTILLEPKNLLEGFVVLRLRVDL